MWQAGRGQILLTKAARASTAWFNIIIIMLVYWI